MPSRIVPFAPPLAFDLAKVEEANQVLEAYSKAKEDQAKATLITCTSDSYGKGCGHRQPVGTTIYIQSHWYVEPHGCTGGDYWKEGEGQFRCDSCGKISRLYDCPEITAMKYNFASIEKVHDRRR